MSSFKDDKAFCVVVGALTTEQTNYLRRYFSLKLDEIDTELRKSIDETKTLVKIKTNVPGPFDGLQWYNDTEILGVLTNGEW
jgi:hypothetical protein